MWQRIGVFSLAVAILAGATHPAARSGQSTACRPVDAFTTGLRDFLVQLDTSSDSTDTDQRTAFGLPVVPVTAITIETDSLVCERAATAYYSRLQNRPSDQAVAVVRMGSVYVVGDPRVTGGEFVGYAVFDSTFTVNVSNFAG